MIIRIKNKQIAAKQCINLVITGLLLLPIYIDLMGTLSLVLGFSTKVTTYLYYGTLWALLIVALPKIVEAVSDKVVIGIALFFMMVIFQYLAFPANRRFLVPESLMDIIIFSPSSLIGVAPFILIGLAVVDTEELSVFLHTGARIGVIMGALSYWLAISHGHDIYYDDMANAYALCTVVCILVANYQKKDIYYLAIGMLSLILAGTRGPFACIIVAVLIRVILLEKASVRKTMKILAGILVVVVLQSDLFNIFLDMIEAFFESIGVTELRIIDYFREDMITDSSGRDVYSEMIKNKIGEAPLIGYGVGGDRIILRQSYVHHLALEMWVSYGVVLGTVFMGWIGYWVLKGFKSKNDEVKYITTALFSSAVVKLFLSSSYLYSKEMFILLGICMVSSKAIHKSAFKDESS